ncbi:hypothetical protein AYO38_06610 [bacterium SCGC AG-212-C10]|nr:hypothetical protein AYO38_06610 [bacterium SCGC AG-212-C10]
MPRVDTPTVRHDDRIVSSNASSSQLGIGGHRLTGPRKAVLETMAAAASPFTAEELCVALPGVGRATVFRTVKLLQELDLVCRVPLEDGSVRYQLSQREHHHHLVCSQCLSVADFSDQQLDALIIGAAQRSGFALDGHSLELYGRCQNCVTAGPGAPAASK